MRAPRTIPSSAAHAAGAVVVGAVVAADPGGWYPFGPTKWLVVSVSLVAAVTATAWEGRRSRLPRRFALTGVAFVAWTMLAAAFGRDPLYAWTGTPERHLGVLAWVLFAAACAVGSAFDRAAIARWTRWCAAAAAWCGGYAGVEWLFGAPIDVAGTTSRLGGPFGSAAYLGAALCLLLPIATGVAVDRTEHRGWRAVGAFAVATSTVALIGSGSRAAWIGLGLAALVALVRLRPRVEVVMVGTAVLGLALVVLAPQLDDVVERSVPADSRLDEWAMATRVIAERPVLGAGPEGYRTVVADGVTAEYEGTYGRAVLPDRAHSAPLDVAATTGLPGMLLHGALVTFVALAAFRALRRGDPRAGIAAGVLATLVQQLLLFPIAELDPSLWIAAGTLIAPLADRVAVHRRDRRVILLAATVAAALFVSGVLAVAADRAAGRAVDQAAAGGGRAAADRALASAERAADLRPDVVRYHLLVAATARATGTLAGVDTAIEAAIRAVGLSPHDPIAQQTVAAVRTERARITGDPADIEAAVAAWRTLTDDDPLCSACQYGLGTAAVLAGDADAAEAAWRAAADLARDGDTRAADALAELSARTGAQGG